METDQYVSIMDCLEYARDRVSFLACMFSAARPECFDINEQALAGLTQTLWGINNILDKAESFLNQEKAKGDLAEKSPHKD